MTCGSSSTDNEVCTAAPPTSRLAQLVERKTLNLVVVGSSPTVGAFFVFATSVFSVVCVRVCGEAKKKFLSQMQEKRLHVRESNPGRLRDRQKCYQLHQRGQASNEIRTRDLSLTKRMLCQLSYRGDGTEFLMPVVELMRSSDTLSLYATNQPNCLPACLPRWKIQKKLATLKISGDKKLVAT